jgi:tetratricopeptide (TPR) repeat protein
MSARLAFALALIATPGPVQEPGRLFEQGVAAYRAGDFESARGLWIDVLESDPQQTDDRADLLYDLGNAAWRLERPFEAIGWYTACVRIAPRHADAWVNLEFARGKAELEPADRGDLEATAVRLVSSLDLAESEWLVIAAGVVLLVAAGFHATLGGALLRRLVWGTALFTGLCLAPWIYNLSRVERDDVMVIAPDGVPALSEPREGATMLARLHPGDELARIDALPGWVRLELEGGTPAWAASDSIFELRR